MVPSLPVEILDHILSFLKSNTAALGACSESHYSPLSQLAERVGTTSILISFSKVDTSSSSQTYLLSHRWHIISAVFLVATEVFGQQGLNLFPPTREWRTEVSSQALLSRQKLRK